MFKKNYKKNFLNQISESGYSAQEFLLIKNALDIADQAHKGQTRKYSGEPYLVHPLGVAIRLMKKTSDTNLILAGILHDCVEDSENISVDQIYQTFGKEVGFLVDSVTDNILYYHEFPNVIFKDKIEKLLWGGMQNFKCLVLKIADRNDNLETLEGLKPNKQIRMTFETQAIYEPLKRIFDSSNNSISFDKRGKLLYDYIQKHKIKNASEFKKKLYSQTFHDFDNDTFDLVYKNTNTIIWKIEDKDMFSKLVETKDFDDKIEVISFEIDEKNNFSCSFKYKKGEVFTDIKSKFKVQKNYFISN